MSIRIVIKHWECDCTKETFYISCTKEQIVDDLDSILISCISTISNETHLLSFHNYYDSYINIHTQGYFPFIIRNGKVEWHIPIQEVTVREFMLTHGIQDGDAIILSEGGVIGGGTFASYYSDIIYWIPILLSDISMILAAKDVYKIIKPLYHKLIGKNNKVASPYEFLELLRTRDSWTISDLQKLTSLDLKTIECMLIQGNFEKHGMEYVHKQSSLNEDKAKTKENIKTIEENLWGAFGYNEDSISQLLNIIHDINLCLTSLNIQSDYHNSECFDIMMKIIDYHIRHWSGYLDRGDNMHYLKLGEDIDSAGEEELHNLCYSSECLSGYLSHLCKTLDTDSNTGVELE